MKKKNKNKTVAETLTYKEMQRVSGFIGPDTPCKEAAYTLKKQSDLLTEEAQDVLELSVKLLKESHK